MNSIDKQLQEFLNKSRNQPTAKDAAISNFIFEELHRQALIESGKRGDPSYMQQSSPFFYVSTPKPVDNIYTRNAVNNTIASKMPNAVNTVKLEEDLLAYKQSCDKIENAVSKLSTFNTDSLVKPQTPAVKFDAGKLDWSLVPMESQEEMVRVLEFGAKKYAAWNWQTDGGFAYTRLINSLLRHTYAFASGEDRDPESGLLHTAHAQCCLMFLAYYMKHQDKFSKDDRFKG